MPERYRSCPDRSWTSAGTRRTLTTRPDPCDPEHEMSTDHDEQLKPMLTTAAVNEAIAAAIAGALQAELAVTIAVVDDGGNLKGFARMDGAPLISIRTAQRKAFAAAAIGIPPDDFFTAIQADPGA